MPRTLRCVVAIAALTLAVPTLAADYNDYPELRPSYPDSWQNGEDNPLRFEAGVRYWYALGEQKAELGGRSFNTTDRSHILEGHFRIDDDMTSSFVKGQLGYAAVIDGEHGTNVGVPTQFSGGQIGYAGADFGWTPFGNDGVKFGAIAGYQFLRESPDRARLDVQSIDGLNIHALRLGVTSRAELSDMFDLEVELAAVPYAYASGATAEIPEANHVVQGVTVNRSNFVTSGALYGASGQVMLGVHPTENLTLRVGGRAWMLTGPSSVRHKQWDAATPNSYLYDDRPLDGFSLARYGLLAEISGRF